jgi:integrase
VLSADEIKAFWKAIERLGWPFYPIYRLLLLTGQRREEVAGMRWVELDLDKAIWIMPAERAKNKLAHTVDLSPQVVAILANLPLMSEGLVFTTTGNTPVSGFSKVKARLDKAMRSELGRELEAWRNHDLRRTMATLMGEELEIDPGVIERILNHVSGSQGGLQGVYQRQQYKRLSARRLCSPGEPGLSGWSRTRTRRTSWRSMALTVPPRAMTVCHKSPRII